MYKRFWAIVATTTVLVGLAGCSTTDKIGGDTVVLKLATISGGELTGAPATFVKTLDRVSGGRLRADVKTSFADPADDAEQQLIKTVKKGDLDGGWVGPRAFAAVGIPGLDALTAPFELTSAAAQKDAVDGKAAAMALGALGRSGLHGVTLLSGAERVPFAHGDPLIGLSDWKGAVFRYYGSPTQKATVTALGGEPRFVGIHWADQAATGSIRGADFPIANYLGNGYSDEANQSTPNVVLWPSMLAVFLSGDTWKKLTHEQQGWVTAAAKAARTASTKLESTASSDEVAKLCARGVVFHEATVEQLKELKTATASVIEGLKNDPNEGALMKEVDRIAAAHPNADTPKIPAACANPSAPIPTTTAPIPDGTYRAQISLADEHAAGVTDNAGPTGIWTLVIANGMYRLTCKPLDRPGRDCGNTDYTDASSGVTTETPLEAGYLRGDRSRVWIVPDSAVLKSVSRCNLDCGLPGPSAFDWSFDGRTLHFVDPTHSYYAQWPLTGWTKIA